MLTEMPLTWLTLLREKFKDPPAWSRYPWAPCSLLLGSMTATPIQSGSLSHNCPGLQMVHR